MRRGISAAARSAAAAHFRFLIADKGLSVTSVHCCKHEGKKIALLSILFPADRPARGPGLRRPTPLARGPRGGGQAAAPDSRPWPYIYLTWTSRALGSAGARPRVPVARRGRHWPGWATTGRLGVAGRWARSHLQGKSHTLKITRRNQLRGGAACRPSLPSAALTRPCCSTPVDNYKLDV